MQIITTAVIKGGTGKTTTAAALAQVAAAEGYKVLAIDLDPQGNLTHTLKANPNDASSYDLLHGDTDVIQRTEQGIDVIAASPDLATERTAPASAKRLQEALEPIKGNYDFIFIDTPPTIGELTYNALNASTGLLIPVETDVNSIQGIYQITDIAKQMQTHNPDLQILGAVLTRYDNRPKINRYIKNIITDGEDTPLLATIRNGIAIREAQALQVSLYQYAPKSKPAQDYKKLFEEIKKNGKKGLH